MILCGTGAADTGWNADIRQDTTRHNTAQPCLNILPENGLSLILFIVFVYYDKSLIALIQNILCKVNKFFQYYKIFHLFSLIGTGFGPTRYRAHSKRVLITLQTGADYSVIRPLSQGNQHPFTTSFVTYYKSTCCRDAPWCVRIAVFSSIKESVSKCGS